MVLLILSMPIAGEKRPTDIGLESPDGIPSLGGRVLEVRKEKSRDAARSRRGKENYEFYELAKLLPLPAAITSQLDKASIIRLSISYLKLRDYCGLGEPPWTRDGQGARRLKSSVAADMFELNEGAHILQSLDGFAFVLSSDGRFLYISETVSIYLGLSQVEMAGSSIFDYVHREDHQELADQLGLTLCSISSTMNSPSSATEDSPQSTRAATPVNDRVPLMTPDADKDSTRSLCVRMKSTLTKRGVHSRTPGYRVVLLLGQFRCQVGLCVGQNVSQSLVGFSGVAIALPPPAITELRIEADTFIMRLASSLKIIYCENVINVMTDWKNDDVCGKDLFSICHPGDIPLIIKIHKDLLTKGQVLSPSVRLLNKGGGYVWMQLCCTTIYSSKTSDDHTFLAIVQIVSGIEQRNLVLDVIQMKTSCKSPRSTAVSDVESILWADPSHPNTPKSSMSPSSEDSQSASNSDSTGIGERDACETQVINKDDSEIKVIFSETNSFRMEQYKSDIRLSRRKTDRPRKRKRESDACPTLVSHRHHDSISKHMEQPRKRVSCSDPANLGLGSSVSACALNVSSNDHALTNGHLYLNECKLTQQQNPEDLSVKPTLLHQTKINSNIAAATNLTACNQRASNNVNALEKAMCRQLPSKPKSPDEDHLSLVDPVWFKPFHSPPKSSLNLLNYSMFANRESVIRTNLTKSLSASTTSTENSQKDHFLHFPHTAFNHKHTRNVNSNIGFLVEEFGVTPPCSVTPSETCVFSESDLNSDCLQAKAVKKHGSTSEKGNVVEAVLGKQPFFKAPNDTNNTSNDPSSNQTVASVAFGSRNISTHAFWYGSPYAS